LIISVDDYRVDRAKRATANRVCLAAGVPVDEVYEIEEVAAGTFVLRCFEQPPRRVGDDLARYEVTWRAS
jgi:hypothetical protein